MMPFWTRNLLPQVRLACPYCYETFPRWRIMFRCSGLAGQMGRRCDPGTDSVYTARFGPVLQLPTFASWRRYTAQCPDCLSMTNVRVCPACHHRLPTHFGRVRSRMVALVGARNSGKTVMLTVFMHELGDRAGERLGAGVWGADEETRRTFAGRYERQLYTDRELHDATRTVMAERAGLRPPMVFSFATEGRSSRARRTLLSFFDTAGEDLRTQESVELNTRYLRSADAVLLVLDPLQMEGGRDRAGMAGPRSTAADEDAYQVLQNITDLLQSGKRAGKVGKPLAVAFSKLDMFWDDMKPHSPLRRPEPTVAGFDEEDSADVQSEVSLLLDDWDGRRIEQFLRLNYRHFHLFGFSALGDSPTADNRIPDSGIQPYRVIDPFLWLLSRLGTVPVARKR